jgi:hypothetical protein
MKILQTWNNKILPENFARCVKSVNDLCKTQGVEHIIVGNHRELFDGFNNITFIPFQGCISKYSTDWWERMLSGHTTQSDFVRLNFLIEDPEIFYIDADVELFAFPEFEKNGKPYFGMSFNYIDFFMVYGNGNAVFFKTLLNSIQKRSPNPFVFMEYFSTLYFEKFPLFKTVNIIPTNCYTRNWF